MDSAPSVPDIQRTDEAIGLVGEQLTASFGALIRAVPGGPFRPQEFARTLGVNKDLSSRVLAASEKRDPIAALHQMPGPAPLRRLLQAAAAKGVSPAVIERASEAVRKFESLIRQHAGDRVSLDAIISEWLPEAREKFELFNKQPVYRGIAQLKGVSVDVSINTGILNLSADGERLDGVWIVGSQGLRRIRPNATIRYFSSYRRPGDAQSATHLTLDGSEVVHLNGLLLEKFCTRPLPEIQALQHGHTVHYVLAGESVGPASAVDLFFAELNPGCLPRYFNPSEPKRHGPGSEITLPAKLHIFDALVHEDVYPDKDPELLVYDLGSNGVADMNDRSRDIDLMQLSESIQYLGKGLPMFRVPEIRSYIDILDHVMAKLGWDHRRFRGYRCRSQYPIYGSQFSMAFTPPQRGEG
jgi:hypothetical protein